MYGGKNQKNKERRAMSEKLLTVVEAAAIAGVSPSLVYGWCAEQLLPHYRFGTKGRRGKILISPAELETFMQSCRVGSHPLLDLE
jgi:excisionase family DNA binding protein